MSPHAFERAQDESKGHNNTYIPCVFQNEGHRAPQSRAEFLSDVVLRPREFNRPGGGGTLDERKSIFDALHSVPAHCSYVHQELRRGIIAGLCIELKGDFSDALCLITAPFEIAATSTQGKHGAQIRT